MRGVTIMIEEYKVQDIFRPKSMPLYTYIDRSEKNQTYESKLQNALENTGTLISITGASKIGKTVLCNKVVDPEKIINISGAQIKNEESFWKQIYEKLDIPIEYQSTQSKITTKTVTGKGTGKISIPFITGIDIESGADFSDTNGNDMSYKKIRNNSTIMKTIIQNDMVVVIDDFHYIEPEIQTYIARTLKTEMFNGLKAILLSLPHRSDDAIRRNPDLIGRTAFIEIKAWSKDELSEIARKGFSLLKMNLSECEIEKIAIESAQSPQLMQENCLNLAQAIKKGRYDSSQLNNIFQSTAENYRHYEGILSHVLEGPSRGRGKRKKYILKDGNVCDIYHLLLLSVSIDPPVLKINMDEIRERIARLLNDNESIPTKLNIANAVKYMESTIKQSIPALDTVEWKDGVLYILDPFLLFCLRWTPDWKNQ